MSNIVHKQEISQMVGDFMYKIDLLPLHPKNKCQLYNRYLLSKILWHLTVADIGKEHGYLKTLIILSINTFVDGYTFPYRVH